MNAKHRRPLRLAWALAGLLALPSPGLGQATRASSAAERIAALGPIPAWEELVLTLGQAQPGPWCAARVDWRVALERGQLDEARAALARGFDASRASDVAAEVAAAWAYDRDLMKRLEGLSVEAREDVLGLVAERTRVRADLGRGRLAEAEELARAHLQRLGESAPGEALLRAESRLDLARVLLRRGKGREAGEVTLQALEELDSVAGGKHPAVAGALRTLARVEFASARNSAARDLCAAATQLRFLHAGRDGLACDYLSGVATASVRMGEREAAEELFATVVAWRMQDERPEAASLGVELHNLAALVQMRGELELAADHYRASVAVIDEAFGEGHPTAARSRSSLATLLVGLGEFPEAERMARGALESYRDSFGEDHAATLTVQTNLGDVLARRGRVREAEDLLRDVLARHAAQGREVHLNVARASSALGGVLVARGDAEGATRHVRAAAGLFEELLGPGHPERAKALSDLANVLYLGGDLEDALAVASECLSLHERLFEADDPFLAEARHDLAVILSARGELGPARDQLARAAQSLAARPDQHPSLRALVYESQADTWLGLGDAVAAEACASAALELRATAGGAQRDQARAERFLARARERQGDLEGALAHAERALAMEESLRAELPGALVDRLRAQAQLSSCAADLTRLHVRAGAPTAAFLAAERGRGRAWLDLLERAQPAARPELVVAAEEARTRAFEAEQTLRALWRHTAVGGTNEASRREQELRVESSRAALEDAEARLHAASLEAWPAARSLDLAELRAALEPGTRLLAYTWSPSAVVLVSFGAEVDGVAAWELASGAEVAALDAELREFVAGLHAPLSSASARKRFEVQAQALAAKLLPQPVADLLARTRRLVLVPDGPLTDLPFEVLRLSLAAGETTNLVERLEEFVLVPSARAYVDCRRRSRQSSEKRRAVLLGDVEFDSLLAAASDAALSRGPASTLEQLRLFGGRLGDLPGTAREVEDLRALFDEQEYEVVTLVGSGATAAELASSSGGARFLHLATHGLPGTRARPFDAALALAYPERPTPEDFGFLTLELLLRTWRGKLEGTDLVVLSACDGQRSAQVGGSALSLPSGFFHAGAASVVASLWPADDEATRLLMQRFYANLLGSEDEPPLSKAAALVEAKRWLRSADLGQVRAAGSRGGGVEALTPGDLRPYADPCFWAGFVLLGAPD